MTINALLFRAVNCIDKEDLTGADKLIRDAVQLGASINDISRIIDEPRWATMRQWARAASTTEAAR